MTASRVNAGRLRVVMGALPLALVVWSAATAAAAPTQPATVPGADQAGVTGPLLIPVAVAPITAPLPPGTVRLGDMILAAPPMVPQAGVDQVNTAGAGAESQIIAFAESRGVPADRAASIAAATVAGGVAGAAIGCVVGGAVLVATIVLAPLLPLDCAKDILIGGATGAAIGAVVGGVRPLPPPFIAQTFGPIRTAQ